MPKKRLNTKDVDTSFCLTKRELVAMLSSDSFDPHTPIVLKCGNKNYMLSQMRVVSGKPVLVGKRGKRDV